MGIQALPQTTVRAIGASQVLTDPAAVVKELVDNALDARATSIAIEISTNTLDVIQVRDNGHGIAPEDRKLVARRYCTSKISGEEDLKAIGGSSLGFRGEALASAAELSGGFTISTRVEGEPVATALKINQQGEIVGQERASLPVGTTVKVTDFIKSNPVRKQVALKHTDQCLCKIKQLLQAYAFARPSVRLSLRVLKAKNDKGNWMYAPKAGGNAEDAAFKIVGAACGSRCTWSVVESDGFTLQAFLPRHDAVAEKISNIGSFLSVDRRPLSTTRGTAKQIVKIFRESLKSANRKFEGIKDPFFYLEIDCTLESYDANVEPAKDDILFEDPDKIIDAARKLFAAVYSVPESTFQDDNQEDTQFVSEPRQSISGNIGDLAVAVKSQSRPQNPNFRPENAAAMLLPSSSLPQVPTIEESTVQRRSGQTFRPSMYGCDEEDVEMLDARPPTGQTEADFEELREARNDISVSNPWVLAKLNASVKQPTLRQATDVRSTAPMNGNAEALAAIVETPRPVTGSSGLLTPRASSPVNKTVFHPSNHVPDLRLANDGRVVGAPSPPPPQFHIPSSPIRAVAPERALPSTTSENQTHNITHEQSHSWTPLNEGMPLAAIPLAGGRTRRSPAKQQGQLNKPFTSPMLQGPPRERVWYDHLEGIEDRPRRIKRPQPQHNSDGLVNQGELSELAEDARPLTPPRRNRDIRGFVLTEEGDVASLVEKRNFPARRRLPSTDASPEQLVRRDKNTVPNTGLLGARGFIPASELAALQARTGLGEKTDTPPSKRRHISHDRVLRSISGNAAPVDDAEDEYLPDTSKRAASRRRSTKTLGRSKSARLPLESMPAGKATQNLVYKSKATISMISDSFLDLDAHESVLSWNQPALDAYDAFVTVVDDDFKNFAGAIHELLINRVCDGEMVQDLGELVKAAFLQHSETSSVSEI